MTIKKGTLARALLGLGILYVLALGALLVRVAQESAASGALLLLVTATAILGVLVLILYVSLVLGSFRDSIQIARQTSERVKSLASNVRKMESTVSKLQATSAATHSNLTKLATFTERGMRALVTSGSSVDLAVSELVSRHGATDAALAEQLATAAAVNEQLSSRLASSLRTHEAHLDEQLNGLRELVMMTASTADLKESEQQLASLQFISTYLQPQFPLARFGGWAVSADLAAHLLSLVFQRQPSFVVEAGSGLSTIVLGMALQSTGGGRIIALEHDAGFAQQTREQVRAQGLDEIVTVEHAPLTPVTIDGQDYKWYDISAISFEPIELLLVDGPPESTGPAARYPAVPVLSEFLAGNAVVLLDDTRRDAERNIAERWHAERPRSSLVFLDHAKGTAELRLA